MLTPSAVTLTYFQKVKDSNRDSSAVVNVDRRVTSARTAVLVTVANAQTSVTSASSDVKKALFAANQIAI